jgi:hypothetical protein
MRKNRHRTIALSCFLLELAPLLWKLMFVHAPSYFFATYFLCTHPLHVLAAVQARLATDQGLMHTEWSFGLTGAFAPDASGLHELSSRPPLPPSSINLPALHPMSVAAGSSTGGLVGDPTVNSLGLSKRRCR